MITTFQAEAAIEVGHHKHWTWHGDFWPYELTFNVDTIVATALAGVVVIALALFLRA
ncbi:F0F1 ATP synthase subunit A, partial [Staphylococcus capitis]|nr:F0F1 ATP synthase subunit A [Staphylococcus capitis]